MKKSDYGKIVKVSGPLVVVEDIPQAKMYDVVRVSEKKLIGEIIELRGRFSYVQVYENTDGIGVGEPVSSTGGPLCVELGPGLVSSIYDGIQRPLNKIREESGDFIARGLEISALDRAKKWDFVPLVKENDEVVGGDILGEVQETPVVQHRVLVPPDVSGKLVKIYQGKFTIDEPIAVVQNNRLQTIITMSHKWPVRKPRPYKKKLAPEKPLFTGQRIIDTFFPVAKGGTACVPGPFGSGKTVIQHQLAKWSDADIIVYIGCGERGNEMADVLIEFPELKDPRTGYMLMLRTVLIANTSNMPVAAREASVYTGVTIAEYFRDMGYSVSVMADSTSRWAEALREMSGRMEEIPGEEGYPAYLPKRLAEFYERAGHVVTLGKNNNEGALSITGAVSPPGGDLSDPVVQGTLKVVKVFWSLEDHLAHARHFPAINWLTSYSQYHNELEEFYLREFGDDWPSIRKEAMEILQKESELKEIVRLIGIDSLSDNDKLILEVAKSIREDYLYQSAFDPVDTFASGKKQYLMLKVILMFYRQAKHALERKKEFEKIRTLPVCEEISRMRFIPEKDLDKINEIQQKITEQIKEL